MYTVVAGRPGAQEYYNSLFELYASWGVDLVKIDDLSELYHTAEIELIRKAIDRTSRKIVLSYIAGRNADCRR
jgi:alpha-galactosidase